MFDTKKSQGCAIPGGGYWAALGPSNTSKIGTAKTQEKRNPVLRVQPLDCTRFCLSKRPGEGYDMERLWDRTESVDMGVRSAR